MAPLILLGATATQLTTGQNIDNLKTPGDYYTESNSVAQSLTGTLPPLNQISAFRLEVRNTMGGRPVQRYYDFNGNSFSRAFNASTWSSWSRADAFGCGTAADLASLLGGIYPIATDGIDSDLDNINKSCVCSINGASKTNCPYSGWCIFISIVSDPYKFQLIAPPEADKIYVRSNIGRPWRRIDTVAV